MLQDQLHRRVVFSTLILTAIFTLRAVRGADISPKTNYEVPMTRAAFDSPLGKKIESECNQLYHLLLDPMAIFNADKRQALLVTARPLLIQYRNDFNQLAVNEPSMKSEAATIDEETTQRLALLGDEDTNKQLEAAAAGTDISKALNAQCILIDNQWTLADGNLAKQTELADTLEKLDHAHPENADLTGVTFKVSSEAASHDLHERMVDLAVNMDNPAAKKLSGMKKIRDAARGTAELVGHPFVLTGKTSDGKDFTTADWKGKVIMVDFWATWCAPCKALLPGVEKFYADNHDKGFEIVSVSNDFDLASLAKYTAENNMPWPELVDADAMKKHTWNPMTLGYGIDGIPHAFVIDKHGILISDDASHTYRDLVEKALAEN